MEIPSVKVPTYTLTLPLSQKEVEYRPFLVKEEKTLINANEQGNITDLINAVGSVISDCTNGEITINSPMFDVQWAFLQIRGKSIGETLEFYVICSNDSCEHKNAIHINVGDFILNKQIGHTNKIDLKNGTTIIMKYPNFHHFASLFEDEDDNKVYEVVAECIDQIVDSDQTFINDGSDKNGMLSWVDNLTPEQFALLENFFLTMPTLQKSTTFICPKCELENKVVIDGIRNFFG